MNVAFIPVRGGSKSIPLKNIKEINGKPLVYWTIKAACKCGYIDKVYIATDSIKIKETVESFKNGQDCELFAKIEVIERSSESASDTASTEFAMLEFANKYDFDAIVLIQATSPLLSSKDLDRGFDMFSEDGTDSVLSVVAQKRFNWKKDEKGLVHAVNYDVFNRPRRQDFEGYLVENGAFYITSRNDLLRSKNRVSGNIKAVEMCEDTFFEIDEPSDWVMVEALMKKNKVCADDGLPNIKMLLTDCDGCLTDGGMYYSEYGDELKKFNTRDGVGFDLLKKNGIIVGIITSENVKLNYRRAEKLKLDILETGCMDKLAKVIQICEERNISMKQVAYIGDDINDIELLKSVGIACCPADAISEVKNIVKIITKAAGGHGVIREVAERILE